MSKLNRQNIRVDSDYGGNKSYQHKFVQSDANDSRSIIFHYVAPGSVVMDVGCSTGYLGEALFRHKNCICHGLEYNEEAAEIARSTTRAYESVSQIDLNRIREDEYPDFACKFDYIIYGDVLEHLFDPEKVLRVMLKYLKPCGRLLISLPNMAHASIKANLLLNDFTYTYYGIIDTTHIRFFTHNSIPSFLAKNRLLIDEFEYTVMGVQGLQPRNPYHDIPMPVKLIIFRDPHSFVVQYVMKIRHAPEKSFSSCLRANAVLHKLDEKRNLMIEVCRDEAFNAFAPHWNAQGDATSYLHRLKCFFGNIIIRYAAGICLLPASMVYAESPGNWLLRICKPKEFISEMMNNSCLVMEKLEKRQHLWVSLVRRSLDVAQALRQTNSMRVTIRKCLAAVLNKSA